MKQHRPIPGCVWWVAVVFVVVGLAALADIVVSIRQHYFPVMVGIVGLIIGPGLLRRSRVCRVCGLFLTILALIGIPLLVLLHLFGGLPAEFKLLGISMCDIPAAVLLLTACVIYTITLWQYHVLNRPDIRVLFDFKNI